MTGKLNILMVSDIHFGKRSMNQDEMTSSFKKTIFPLMEELDILFINGDLFDNLVNFDHYIFEPIYNTLMEMFHLCQKHDVTLRVLQGTYGHDRNQCKRLEIFYRNGGFTFNFDFIPVIELEEISFKERNLRILYIPDSLPFKSSTDVIKVVEGKMLERGWDYIDYACIHGFFDITFPANVSRDNTVVFDESQFPFVRKAIDVGHVHQYRAVGKVISNGSFDRLGCGEEDPKGCIYITDSPDTYTARFIANLDPAIYDTLRFGKDDDTDVIRNRIDRHLKCLNTTRTISIRCIIESVDHRDAIKGWLSEFHPDVRCSIKREDTGGTKPTISSTAAILRRSNRKIPPTPETISSHIRAFIDDISPDYELSIEDIDQYLEAPV